MEIGIIMLLIDHANMDSYIDDVSEYNTFK